MPEQHGQFYPKPRRIESTGNSYASDSSSFLSTQGWYDNVIAVDPFNSNNIYVGGVDMMKSTNGGTSWFQLTYWDNYYGTPEVHADHMQLYLTRLQLI